MLKTVLGNVLQPILRDSPIFPEDLENCPLAIVNPQGFGPVEILSFADLHTDTIFSQPYALISMSIVSC